MGGTASKLFFRTVCTKKSPPQYWASTTGQHPNHVNFLWLFRALARAQGSRELQNSKGSRKRHLSEKNKKNFNQERSKDLNKNNRKLQVRKGLFHRQKVTCSLWPEEHYNGNTTHTCGRRLVSSEDREALEQTGIFCSPVLFGN